MPPIFTNDAVVFGILLIVLASIFYTSSLETKWWKKFYTYVPALLLCYFVPALLNWPLGLIKSEWYDIAGLREFLQNNYVQNLSPTAGFERLKEVISENNISQDLLDPFMMKSKLYFVASRFLLPASLVMLTLSIDFKGIMKLGPKALIMFFTATIGIIIGGPIALFIISNFAPGLIGGASPDDLWRGLSTVAGSWIGGGANQTAMKEIYGVSDRLFSSMIVVDVVVANIWMGFLLYGAGIREKVDRWLKADSTAITTLENKMEEFQKKVARIPDTTTIFILLAVAFGAVALSHAGADLIIPWMSQYKETLVDWRLTSLMSGFFWLIVISTTIGLLLSFTKARKLEGIGASRWGSIFIYILVATIGMKMNIQEVFENLGVFAVGLVWMLVHVIILLVVAYLIKAPFFFVAVGSQANVGGAASAPIVASAFNPVLAPVGVLMAVLGYALGTYGAIICALLMQSVVT